MNYETGRLAESVGLRTFTLGARVMLTFQTFLPRVRECEVSQARLARRASRDEGTRRMFVLMGTCPKHLTANHITVSLLEMKDGNATYIYAHNKSCARGCVPLMRSPKIADAKWQRYFAG
eukprot:1178367-Prorocentrum_minimum.AAC.1